VLRKVVIHLLRLILESLTCTVTECHEDGATLALLASGLNIVGYQKVCGRKPCIREVREEKMRRFGMRSEQKKLVLVRRGGELPEQRREVVVPLV
jgi:hypothetical protein